MCPAMLLRVHVKEKVQPVLQQPNRHQVSVQSHLLVNAGCLSKQPQEVQLSLYTGCERQFGFIWSDAVITFCLHIPIAVACRMPSSPFCCRSIALPVCICASY